MENRYSRQIAYLGKKSQEKIQKSSVCIIGCGALGSASAELLTRAGVGKIKLVDRDFLELSNLQRQHVFSEEDINKPKALALAEKLRKINSSVKVEYDITDFNSMNAESLIKEFSMVIDGLDNSFSRFILNETCVKLNVPWIYGSAIKNVGYVSFIDPKKNCLRCFIRNPPSKTETCEAAGVTNAITTLISSVQVNETLVYLAGKEPPLNGRLFYANLENVSTKIFDIKKDVECPACSLKKFELLGNSNSNFTSLCGNDSYHISPPSKVELDLKGAEMRLPKHFVITSSNEFLVRACSGNKEITVFYDGRMITKNIKKNDAETIYKKTVLI